MPQSFVKDPVAVEDYAIDWGQWLDGDQLVASTWTIVGADGSLTQIASSIDASTSTGAPSSQARVWLGGGTLGGTYNVINRITTNSSPIERVTERTLLFVIQQL